MSKAQKEIASTHVDLQDSQKLNAIILNLALLVSTIVFTTGLAIFLSSINSLAAYISLVTLLAAAYPVFRLYKLKAAFLLPPFIMGLVLLTIGVIMLLFVPVNEVFLTFHLFLICLVLVISPLIAIAVAAKRNGILTKEHGALIAFLLIASLSVLLLVWFKDSPEGVFKLQFWKGSEIELKLHSLALTYFSLIFITIGLIMLTAFLFTQKKQRFSSKYLTYLATFAALSVVFKLMGNALSGAIPSAKFTLVYIPWVAAGIVLDPFGAIVAAAVGDFLGQILIPTGGPWFWLTSLSNMIFPLFPALIFHAIRSKEKYADYVKLITGIVISTIICTLGLGTAAIAIIYDMTYWAALALRPVQLIVIAINLALLIMLLPVLKRIKLNPKR